MPQPMDIRGLRKCMSIGIISWVNFYQIYRDLLSSKNAWYWDVTQTNGFNRVKNSPIK